MIDSSLSLAAIPEKITLVNADIEGNEYALLEAIQERITRDRPVVSICAYHKKEDLVKLPSFLVSVLPKSKLILRKYESGMTHPRRETELVLYAVPEERLVL